MTIKTITESEILTSESFWNYKNNKKLFLNKFEVYGCHNVLTKEVRNIYVNVPTLEGEKRATLNDLVVKTVEGNYDVLVYKCCCYEF